mmetsp:Transcript_71371/g.115149  ORF Transcript_71371/g.115149 Transcript_71371/m.115149 type:complete len:148 (-) Transcript_71371:5-448(-)
MGSVLLSVRLLVRWPVQGPRDAWKAAKPARLALRLADAVVANVGDQVFWLKQLRPSWPHGAGPYAEQAIPHPSATQVRCTHRHQLWWKQVLVAKHPAQHSDYRLLPDLEVLMKKVQRSTFSSTLDKGRKYCHRYRRAHCFRSGGNEN